MNYILSMVKSLHSTLYTVGLQVSLLGRAEDDVDFQSLRAQPQVKERFQRGALIA